MKELMRFYLIKTVGILLIIISAVFSLQAKTVQADIKKGGIISLSLLSTPKSFNPIVANDANTAYITGLMFSGLLEKDVLRNKMIPCLASRYDVSEDGLTYVFHLRKNLQWSDGSFFSADDVVFTFNELIYNSKIPCSAASVFTINNKKIEVIKIDDLTVKMVLPEKFAPFLLSMSQSIMPKHLLSQSVLDGTFTQSFGVDSKPSAIAGTGPYVLSKYDVGQKVVLKRNPNYFKKDQNNIQLPYIDVIEFLITRNADTSLVQFKEGVIDFYGMRGSDFPVLKPLEKENDFAIYRLGASLSSSFLGFNMTKRKNADNNFVLDEKKQAWFSNVFFRRAVAMAIDRQSMIDIAYNGLGHIQHSPLSPAASDFYNDAVVKYKYDPDTAKKLLAENGFNYNKNKLFDNKGNRVSFNLFFSSDSTAVKTLAGMIRQDFANIGIDVNLLQVEFNSLVGKLTATGDWDAVFLSLTGSKEPHFGANLWKSSGVLHFWNPSQKEPQTSWEAEIDTLFSQAVKELNKEKRKEYYDKWQMIVSEQVPLVYLIIPESIVAVKNKFGNIKPVAAESVIHNIDQIYIKEEVS